MQDANQTRTTVSGAYFPGVCGLRGLAVLSVMFFHCFSVLPWSLPGWQAIAVVPLAGWLGVDIFFVISGFLITGILLDTREEPHWFRTFYIRRALRILPAYYSLLALVLFVLPLFIDYSTPGLRMILHRQGWLWTHLTNLSYVYYNKVWTQADWLEMNHLWSLAVEEQFYLIWPLAIYFAGRKRLPAVCMACIGLSLGLRIFLWLSGQRNGAVYFPTPCRLDGLAMGALLAISIRNRPGGETGPFPLLRLAGMGSVAALAGIWWWRGGLALTDKVASVFAVTLVGIATMWTISGLVRYRVSGPTATFLSSRFLRWTGGYSYGLYLAHALILLPLSRWVPPEKLAQATGSEVVGNLAFVALFLACSCGVALISWHANEKHWLKAKARLAPRFRSN